VYLADARSEPVVRCVSDAARIGENYPFSLRGRERRSPPLDPPDERPRILLTKCGSLVKMPSGFKRASLKQSLNYFSAQQFLLMIRPKFLAKNLVTVDVATAKGSRGAKVERFMMGCDPVNSEPKNWAKNEVNANELVRDRVTILCHKCRLCSRGWI
jgi:hypothetical protein